MTGDLVLGMRDAKCPVCGKRFAHYTAHPWAFRIKKGHKKVLACSWHCMREYERTVHMGSTPLNEMQKAKVRALLAEGKTQQQIVEETGLSKSSVYRIAKAEGAVSEDEEAAGAWEEPEAAPPAPAPGKIAVRVRRTWETENVSVFEDDGRIEIELSTTENDTVESLRSYGEQFIAIAEEIEHGKDH